MGFLVKVLWEIDAKTEMYKKFIQVGNVITSVKDLFRMKKKIRNNGHG